MTMEIQDEVWGGCPIVGRMDQRMLPVKVM